MSRSRQFVAAALFGALSLPLSASAQSHTRELRELDRAQERAKKKLVSLTKTLRSAESNLAIGLRAKPGLWTAYEKAQRAVEAERATLHTIAIKVHQVVAAARKRATDQGWRRLSQQITSLRQERTKVEDELLRQAREFDVARKRLREEIAELGKRATRQQAKHARELAAAKGVERGLRERLSQRRSRRVRQLQRDLDQRLVKLDLQGKSPRAVLAELTWLTGISHTLTQVEARSLPASVALKAESQSLRGVLDLLAGRTGTSWRREADRIVFHRRGKERRTPSGLRIQDLVVARGANPRKGDTVVLHYSLWIEDELIDSSRDRDQPLRVVVDGGKVIRGFAEGIADLRVGAKRRLVVPPALGYGAKGKGPVPPNATLVFEVELLEVVRP